MVKKEVVRELETDQHVSFEANVSRFPFIFFNLSWFSILLNAMSSQGVFYSKDIHHGNVLNYDTKTISCTIRATYYARTT